MVPAAPMNMKLYGGPIAKISSADGQTSDSQTSDWYCISFADEYGNERFRVEIRDLNKGRRLCLQILKDSYKEQPATVFLI